MINNVSGGFGFGRAPLSLLFTRGPPRSPLLPLPGPDRKLYLPEGLLSDDSVPAYLNGELPGE